MTKRPQQCILGHMLTCTHPRVPVVLGPECTHSCPGPFGLSLACKVTFLILTPSVTQDMARAGHGLPWEPLLTGPPVWSPRLPLSLWSICAPCLAHHHPVSPVSWNLILMLPASPRLSFCLASGISAEQSAAAAAAKLLQSCPALCDPRDGSPKGSHDPGILQARTLEWVAIFFSNA